MLILLPDHHSDQSGLHLQCPFVVRRLLLGYLSSDCPTLRLASWWQADPGSLRGVWAYPAKRRKGQGPLVEYQYRDHSSAQTLSCLSTASASWSYLLTLAEPGQALPSLMLTVVLFFVLFRSNNRWDVRGGQPLPPPPVRLWSIVAKERGSMSCSVPAVSSSQR